MKRIFLDTNILLDLIDPLRPGHSNALRMEALVIERKFQGLFAWHSLSVIEYLGRKQFGATAVHELIAGLLQSFIIPKTGTEEAILAFRHLANDFEDAMQIAAAIAGDADCIVTSDKKGFINSPVPVITPLELCKTLSE
jgi:predicted nucleic acid-binding protein